MTIGRRLSLAAMAACALTVISAAAPGPVAAQPGRPAATGGAAPEKPVAGDPLSTISPESKARMFAQRPFSEAAKVIQSRIVSNPAATGYSGIAVRPHGVELWWKGALPADVRQAIEQARRSVPVDVRSARYSQLELKAAATRFEAAMKSDPDSSLFMVQAPIDGSRLIVVYDKDAPAVATAGRARSALRTSHRPTARSIAIDPSGIPVDVVMEKRVKLQDRWNDGQQGGVFSGGAAIYNGDNGKRCTSGFGVTNGTYEWLLTAGHCSRVGTKWWNGNHTRVIGSASWEVVQHDLILIPTQADGYIWDGGATSNMFVKSVSGWDWVRSGEYVCQSGSSSGTVCDIVNSNNFTFHYCENDFYGNQECYYDLIYATKANGVPSQGGDSGGPVFVLNPDNTVLAKGIVSGGNGDNVMTYQDFGTAYRDFGIWITR